MFLHTYSIFSSLLAHHFFSFFSFSWSNFFGHPVEKKKKKGSSDAMRKEKQQFGGSDFRSHRHQRHRHYHRRRRYFD